MRLLSILVSLCKAHGSDHGAQGRVQFYSVSKSGEGGSTKMEQESPGAPGEIMRLSTYLCT